MEYILNLAKLYAGNGVVLFLYAAAWVLIVALEKEKEKRIVFAFSAWYLPLVILNPLLGLVLAKLQILPERIVRLYWLVPVFIVIAYGFSLLVRKARERAKLGGVTAAILCAVLVLTGSPIVSAENYVRAENVYKLPDGVIQIVDMVNQDAQALSALGTGMEQTKRKTAMPLELSTYARQYDGTLPLLYGRYPDKKGEKTENVVAVYEMMQQEILSIEELAERSKREGCRYLVLDSSKEWEDIPDEKVIQPVGTYGNYCLYRLD